MLIESTILVGGVLIILCAALGLTNYLIDAQIPAKGAAWVTAGIHSRWAFLLLLNGFLLVVGCLMDIFSAIFVVVPLILPVAAALAGMNLFLSSFRFNTPMPRVIRAVLPFTLVQFAAVLLVSFIPLPSEGFARWWAR